MLFVFLTQIVFFGLFFWNADKLNRSVQRTNTLRQATNGRMGVNI